MCLNNNACFDKGHDKNRWTSEVRKRQYEILMLHYFILKSFKKFLLAALSRILPFKCLHTGEEKFINKYYNRWQDIQHKLLQESSADIQVQQKHHVYYSFLRKNTNIKFRIQ